MSNSRTKYINSSDFIIIIIIIIVSFVQGILTRIPKTNLGAWGGVVVKALHY
jgi:hypothetical protein